MWISRHPAGAAVCRLRDLHTPGTRPAVSPVKPGLDFRDRPNRKRFSVQKRNLFSLFWLSRADEAARKWQRVFLNIPTSAIKCIFLKMSFQYWDLGYNPDACSGSGWMLAASGQTCISKGACASRLQVNL